ncbi:MAG: phosphatidate cytidylyltransferase [Calditrichia bacterium]
MNELIKRILVAVIGAPLVIFLIISGGNYFLLLALVIGMVSLWEFYTMFRQKELFAYRVPGVVIGAAVLATIALNLIWLPVVLLLGFAILLLLSIRKQEAIASLNAAITVSGVLYIAVFLGALLHLRLNFEAWYPSIQSGYAGGKLILLAFLAIWICDIAAYFCGKAFGKHKLAPSVSPKKTIEGAVSGLVGAIATAVGIGMLLLPQLPLGDLLATGLIAGVFGQMGDLVESRFKRDAGVKDSSSLLPGHGGLLDRFDSLIFVSPFLWCWFFMTQLMV